MWEEFLQPQYGSQTRPVAHTSYKLDSQPLVTDQIARFNSSSLTVEKDGMKIYGLEIVGTVGV